MRKTVEAVNRVDGAWTDGMFALCCERAEGARGAWYYSSAWKLAGMKWTGKVVGGALGLLARGPIGAAVGVLLGHQFDEHSGSGAMSRACAAIRTPLAIGEHFFRATFRVMGYLAKADGRVSESEIAAARAVSCPTCG